MILNNLQIKIKNFKSIKQTDWISLDGKIEVMGKNYIDGGSNGSGKSSILEALYTSVILCELSDVKEYAKELKKYYKDQEYPFEILVKFNVQNIEYQIEATPEGIKNGSIDAKNHLYKLITSFLMQGMSNSLIMQEASDCKSTISSYFECDRIINNIFRNSIIVKEKLEDKINYLEKKTISIAESLAKAEANIENSNSNLIRYKTEKLEIHERIGIEEIFYDEKEYNALILDIDLLSRNIEELDKEISQLYQEMSAYSNGIETTIKELKSQRDKILDDSKSLYIRMVGNKFSNFIKKITKEYNENQKIEYEVKNKNANNEKERKISEIKEKIEILQRTKLNNKLLSNDQKVNILNLSSKYTKFISEENKITSITKETDKYYKDILNEIKTKEFLSIETLEKELVGIKKSSVKKILDIEVFVYTQKNKPKRNLPKYFIVYNCDTETNKVSLLENSASMIDDDKINVMFQEIESYQKPDVSELDNRIIELEKSDKVNILKEIDNNLIIKQTDKVHKSSQLKTLKETEFKMKELKLKSDLYSNDKEKLKLLEASIFELENTIKENIEAKDNLSENLSKVKDQKSRWIRFLDEINKDSKLVQNSFKDYIITLYNDRISPLIDFYSNKIYSLNSKLVVKIGSKSKQPTLNGIKFDFTSGGEKSKALFIFSLAHRDYLSKQRGFNNNYIFCDEVFDGMDEISRQQSIQFLTQSLSIENITVISHMEDKSLPNFKQISVLKTENGTSILQ